MRLERRGSRIGDTGSWAEAEDTSSGAKVEGTGSGGGDRGHRLWGGGAEALGREMKAQDH
jgi:hypothetical protein